MPSMSEKQHNAMMAAAHGKSTLHIPMSVGKEFVAADKKQGKKYPPVSHTILKKHGG